MNRIFHPTIHDRINGKQRDGAMGMMIVRHKLRDYGEWRPTFDQHAEMQRGAGLLNARVYHSADSNKSEIVVVFDTEDTRKAKEFAASVNLKECDDEGWGFGHPDYLFP